MAQEYVSAGGIVYYGWSGRDDDADDLATGLELLTTGMSNRITFDTVAANVSGETVGYLKYSWMGTDTNNMPYAIAYFRYENSESKGYKFTIYDSGSGDVYAYFNPSANIDNPEWNGIGQAIWTGNNTTGVTTAGQGKQSMCVANIAMTPIGSTNAGATRAIVGITSGGAPYVYGRDNTSTFTIHRAGLSPDSSANSKITVLGPVFASTCGGVSTHARIPVQKSTPLSPGSYSINGIQYQIVGAVNSSGLLAIRGNTSTISTS